MAKYTYFAGDVIPGETRPIEVRFSISKDTDDDPHDGVYDWQTPDFMTESLFANFLTEIVDIISNPDKQRFLQLLDPFSASWDELRKWNQKQNKWFDHDGNKICWRVRKACNEKRIGDFITLRPSQGTVRNIDVRINNETDPCGELRREINQLKASREPEVLEETGDDKYPSDDEEEAIYDEVQANPENPNCYYPSQEKMAAILKKRIDKIMSHYHGISRLSDAFNDVEFTVYTARYKMLRDQTEKRIHHPNAGVLSKEELESRDDGSGKKRMFMYIHSNVTEDHFEQLKGKVHDKPNTLFVIIADECHWGITKDKEEKSSAHNLFINEWCKGSPHRNVVVVQISATPFNLLTQNSRLPKVRCEVGNLEVLERESNLQDHESNNSKEVELHVVHWSEVELKNFETGIRMKLKSALNFKDSRYLYVSPDGKLTTVEEDATDFIVQGTHGIVTLQALASKEKEAKLLTVSRDAHRNLKATVDFQQPTKFQVKLDFGVGVVAFCSCENPDHYLAVNELGNVTLKAASVERKWGVSIMKPKASVVPVSFQFYTEVVEVDMAGQQYLSLNYYLSTINCSNKSDQKIREDESFQKRQKKMTDSSSFPIDAFLCAEYCYHILHVSVYNSDEKICQALASPADESPAAEFDRRLDSFICKLEEIPETSEIEYIHPKAFKLVREQLRDEAASDFKENVKIVAQLLKNKSSKETQGEYEVLATSFVACLMYLSQQEMQQIKEETHLNSIIENMTQTLQANDCQKMVKTWNCIVEDSETLSLVKNLIQSGKGKRGKMKIVRAKSTKNANQFYHTLQLARKESSLEDCFEIIKDYGEIQIEKQLMKPSSPFFQKLQPDICMYKSDCSCSERIQQQGCPKCANCHHVHKNLEELCRYVKVSVHESHVDHTPYVLVGKELFKKFKASLNKSPSMCAVDCTSVDRYMTVANKKASTSTSKETASFPLRWLNYEAQKDSYDHQNQETHCNRILLQAEPQIGKTGSYLCLIKYLREDILGMENDSSKSPAAFDEVAPGKLREDILGMENDPSKSPAAFDEGTIYRHKECHPSTIDVVNDDEGAYDWNFPYWKTIEDSPSLSVKPVAPGKYSIGGCFYTHDTQKFPYHLMKSGQSNRSKSSHHLEKGDCIDDMRAWHWYHFKNMC
ncbi:GREB1-like protein [Desmophyllum pertusum]|uniref:GREB1-like protein n=1 Tax=Desmophyllum pertusum TaxID=174260 RepID=A0A9X0CZC6_9CNID|nr:GREB1-like protein [Desmophyllum pertusum]